MKAVHAFLLVIKESTNRVKEIWFFPSLKKVARQKKLKEHDKELLAQYRKLKRRYPAYDVVLGITPDKKSLKKVFQVKGWKTAIWHDIKIV